MLWGQGSHLTWCFFVFVIKKVNVFKIVFIMAIISYKKFHYNELQVVKDWYLLCFVSLHGSTLLMNLDETR
jgi:hypothetical protein